MGIRNLRSLQEISGLPNQNATRRFSRQLFDEERLGKIGQAQDVNNKRIDPVSAFRVS